MINQDDPTTQNTNRRQSLMSDEQKQKVGEMKDKFKERVNS